MTKAHYFAPRSINNRILIRGIDPDGIDHPLTECGVPEEVAAQVAGPYPGGFEAVPNANQLTRKYGTAGKCRPLKP